MAHHQAGRLAEAATVYRGALERWPLASEALHLLGVVEGQLGRTKQAAQLIERSLAIAPNVPEAHNNLANCFLALGDAEGAIASCRRALSLDDNCFEAHNNLGNALWSAGRPDEAIREYRCALRLSPGYADAYINLGFALAAHGEAEEAIEAYLRAVELAPQRLELRLRYGVALRRAGRLEEALSVLQDAAIRLDDSNAHYELGLAYKSLGRIDEAVGCLRRSLELSPQNGSARHTLAALTGVTTTTAPLDYVRNLFDGYSATFDRHLMDELGYRVPHRLRDVLLAASQRPVKFRDALDIGCGTGLVGERLRDLVERLTGLDVSEQMAARARRRGVYDRVVVEDAISFLAAAPERFDLLTAADVLIYVGALEPLFAGAARAAQIGAYFVFSTEESSGPEYELLWSGRYAHSEVYVREIARKTGFCVESCTRERLRRDKRSWVIGQIFMVCRSASALSR